MNPPNFLFDKYDLYSTRPRLLNQEQRYEKTSSESLPEIGRKNSYFLFLNFVFLFSNKNNRLMHDIFKNN